MNDTQKDIELVEISIENCNEIPPLPQLPQLPPLPPSEQLRSSFSQEPSPLPQENSFSQFTINDIIGPINEFPKENVVSKWHKYVKHYSFRIITNF